MSVVQETPAERAAAGGRRAGEPPTWRSETMVLLRLVAWTILAAVAVAIVLAGIAAREDMWRTTEPVRYGPDMRNAWYWGSRAVEEGAWEVGSGNGGWSGYFSLYDTVITERPDGQYGLDYVPLRLLVMTAWAKYELARGVTDWANTREMNAPLLLVNYVSDLVAGLGVFAIVFTLLRRAGKTYLVTGWLSVIAGALLWLNPAVTVSGFGRPTWDVWILPFFLLACLAGVWRQWAVAGALVGVGAMFKGQILAVMPFLLVWFLWVGGPRAVLSLLGALVLAVGAVVSPWIFTRGGWGSGVGGGGPKWDWAFVAYVMLAGLVPLGLRYLLRRQRYLPSWRWTLTLALCLMAAVTVFSAAQPGASLAWWEIGFRYGADKFPQLEVGGASSLAGLLTQRYGWRADSVPFGSVPALTMKNLLVGLYGVCAVLCGIAAGIAHRSRDPRRLLVAIPAVWIAYFAFMPLMHERYLLWGAACAALCAGISPGLSLLGLLLSIESWLMTLRVMLIGNNNGKGYELLGYPGETWKVWFDLACPGAAWGVMFASLVFVYLSFGSTHTSQTRGDLQSDRPR